MDWLTYRRAAATLPGSTSGFDGAGGAATSPSVTDHSDSGSLNCWATSRTAAAALGSSGVSIAMIGLPARKSCRRTSDRMGESLVAVCRRGNSAWPAKNHDVLPDPICPGRKEGAENRDAATIGMRARGRQPRVGGENVRGQCDGFDSANRRSLPLSRPRADRERDDVFNAI